MGSRSRRPPLGGGGILAFFCGGCTITLNDSTVTGNTVAGTFAGGGGIFTLGAHLVLNNSTVSGNTAGVGGGVNAVCTQFGSIVGSLTLNNSTVSNNHAASAGQSGGGGIFTQMCATTLSNSAVSHNSSNGYGGGIRASGVPGNGALFLNNSTVSDNSALVSGGGLYTSVPVTLDATSSISNNTPDNCAGTGCP